MFFSVTWPAAQQKQWLCLEIDFFFSFWGLYYLYITRLNELSESGCHSIIQIHRFIRVKISIREFYQLGLHTLRENFVCLTLIYIK